MKVGKKYLMMEDTTMTKNKLREMVKTIRVKANNICNQKLWQEWGWLIPAATILLIALVVIYAHEMP